MDDPSRQLRRALLFLLPVGMASAVGCAADRTGLIRQLESPEASERIVAIVKLTGHAEASTGAIPSVECASVIPLLVDRLGDEDEGVRFYAILALDRLAGTRLGYDYAGPASRRREAIQRWKAHVSTGQEPPSRQRVQPTGAEATPG